MFSEEFSELRDSFLDIMDAFLRDSEMTISKDRMSICETNINSVLQRVSPEYTITRFAQANESNSTPGASEELLVVTNDDIAVRAYRLEEEQINIVNKITKGEQLILACAGSGKSVLLISKCFKAARMNPDKRFLITCYNRNLQSLYTWFIERAGLQERNVDCYTFDGLCKRLIEGNHLPLPRGRHEIIEERRTAAINYLSNGKIKDRYYGIFIDEVQMFELDWYKFCYNLLENKDSDDHIFVICGDKTQEIKRRQRHGRAPWNAGEGYPTYRGGKSIRIEKNFRNCIEINDYINRFAQNARDLIKKYNSEEKFDPDMFLRGQAFRNGKDVVIKQFNGNAIHEARHIVQSIKKIHDEEKVPYDEIAVLMYNTKYIKLSYYIEKELLDNMIKEGIPYVLLYNNEQNWAGRYGSGGVSLITFGSALGLDFQAVIVCGLKSLGEYDGTKVAKPSDERDEDSIEKLKENISYLYVACTRAKDHLHIILGESSDKSIYYKLLTDSEK